MDLTRRRLLLLAAAGAATAMCRRTWAEEMLPGPQTQPSPTSAASASDEAVVDAGPLSDFTEAGVYTQFREQGFFIIHRGKQIVVLSSVCTHKGCKVRAQDDQSFLCKCHGSRFDPEGVVTKGPAQRNLPRLDVARDDRGHLLVRKPG